MKNNKKKSGLIAALLLVVLLIGVIAFILWRNAGDSSSDLSLQTSKSENDISNSSTGKGDSAAEGSWGLTEVEDFTTLSWLEKLEIPEWDGKNPYVVVNGNTPFFDTDIEYTGYYEDYYPLDELGRCTLADAIVGPETQPTEKRGNISSVKPTGWHTDKYDFVNGEALYNRCHLIAYYLGAENANERNLVTGTRYMNEDGMNDFENMTGDYIKETGNHVRYRVTPVWTGDNLICDGLLVEAWSIEDKGRGICFNIYCYNLQPGVTIDYKTGDNYATGSEEKKPLISISQEENLPLLEEDVVGTYILNVKKMKFHRPDCDGIKDISAKNAREYYGSRNALVMEGYIPCGGCNP